MYIWRAAGLAKPGSVSCAGVCNEVIHCGARAFSRRAHRHHEGGAAPTEEFVQERERIMVNTSNTTILLFPHKRTASLAIAIWAFIMSVMLFPIRGDPREQANMEWASLTRTMAGTNVHYDGFVRLAKAQPTLAHRSSKDRAALSHWFSSTTLEACRRCWGSYLEAFTFAMGPKISSQQNKDIEQAYDPWATI